MSHHNPHQEILREMALRSDKEDLLEVITMRFGSVPEEIRTKIEAMTKLDTLERLVLVAANVASWEIFLNEFYEGQDSFNIVGEAFNPLANVRKPPQK